MPDILRKGMRGKMFVLAAALGWLLGTVAIPRVLIVAVLLGIAGVSAYFLFRPDERLTRSAVLAAPAPGGDGEATAPRRVPADKPDALDEEGRTLLHRAARPRVQARVTGAAP